MWKEEPDILKRPWLYAAMLNNFDWLMLVHFPFTKILTP
jgi:hypothetical protein